MAINTIVFDLDDTLFDEIEYVMSGFEAVSDYCRKNYNVTDLGVRLKEEFKNANDGRVFNRALQSVGLSDSDEFIQNLVSVYRGHSPKITLKDGAKVLLTSFSKRFNIALITDGYSITQHNKIAALDIKQFFNCIVVTDDLGGRDFWKPSEVPYRTVENYFNVEPNECVYIGDNVNKDFITAKKIGWHTVHLNNDEGVYSNEIVSDEYRADTSISSLIELQSFFGNTSSI